MDFPPGGLTPELQMPSAAPLMRPLAVLAQITDWLQLTLNSNLLLNNLLNILPVNITLVIEFQQMRD